MPFGKPSRWSLAALLVTALFGTSASAQGMGGGRGGAPVGPRDVGVMVVAEESVPYTVTLPGRAVAFQETGIRPQVGGEVREIVYHSGRPVKTGDVLFRLDPETLSAALAAAEASVEGAQASLSSAEAMVQRYRKLERSSVSSVDLTNAEVALKEAQASLKSAEAQRDVAQLQLKRTDIVSPIDGFPAVPSVSVGDLVTANQSETLTTITQLDPIYVDVNETSARILRNRERFASGNLLSNGQIQTTLILETGETYKGQGEVVTPGITVSPTTGTVPIRLQFDNPDSLILPGQFLRVEVTVGTTRAMLIPQRATRRASDGTLTAYVVRDGKSQEVTLSEAGSFRNSWIVTQGVNEGEQLILDGLENMRSGMEVKPVNVTIDASGVVRDSDHPVTTAEAANADAAANAKLEAGTATNEDDAVDTNSTGGAAPAPRTTGPGAAPVNQAPQGN